MSLTPFEALFVPSALVSISQSSCAHRHADKPDDFDRFNALLVQQEIQTYYLMPLPGYDSEGLKRNIMRAYTTARAVISVATDLDVKHDFMRHLPHFYFRSLLSASCIIYKVLRSCYMDFVDRNQIEKSISEVISICRSCTIQEGDLAMRLSNLLESFWGLSKVARWHEEPICELSERLGASVNFDCLRKWKEDMDGARPRSVPPPTEGDETTAVPAVVDPMANIDWSFMDEFDWNFEPTLFT
jgi:transcriptional regulatory protein LEU3